MGKRKSFMRGLALFLTVIMVTLCLPCGVFAGTGGLPGMDQGAALQTGGEPGGGEPTYENGAAVVTSMTPPAGTAVVNGTNITITVPYAYEGTTMNLNSSSISHGADYFIADIKSVSGEASVDGAAVTMTVEYTYASDSSNAPYTTDYSVRVVRTPKVDATFTGSITKNISAVYTFKASDFTDLYTQNDGEALSKISITGGDSPFGALNYNGSAYVFDTPIAIADIGKLTFVPAGTTSGAANFLVTGYEGTSQTGFAPIRMTINFEYIVDTTVDTISAGNINQNEAYDFARIRDIIAMEFEDLAGEALTKIKFTPPTNGTLYKNFTSLSAPGTAVSSSDEFSVSAMGNLDYVPASAGTASIEYKAYGASNVEYTGTITFTVNAVSTTLSTITAEVWRGSYLTFNSIASQITSKFSTATGSTLDYVTFTLPSNTHGTLRATYNGSTLTDNNKCYRTSQSGKTYLADVTFTPNGSVTARTIDIEYSAFDANGLERTGIISLSIKVPTNDPSVSISVAQDEYEILSGAEFATAFTNATGKELRRIYFSQLPNSSYAYLYKDYSPSASSNTQASTGTYYYYNETTPKISDLTVVPNGSRTGSTTAKFYAYATDGSQFSGTLTIDITAGSTDLGTITYQVRKGGHVDLVVSDFTNSFNNNGDGTLSYIRFTQLPSSSYAYLYKDYSASSSNSTVSSSTRYYRNSSPYISDVTFVPKSSYTGTITLRYTAYNTSGDSYTGKLRFIVSSSATGGDLEDIVYEVNDNSSVDFVNADLNLNFKDYTDENYSYMKFTSLPSSSYGTLYYKYQESGQTAVSTSKEYYRSQDPRFGDITFVPKAGYSGTVEIPYKAYTSGGTAYSGAILVDVTKVSATTLRDLDYSVSNDQTILFPSSVVESLVKSESNQAMSYMTFTLPSSSYGTLYYNWSSKTNPGTAVSANTKYYKSGSPQASLVRFVPNSSYVGTVSLNYTAYDVAGKSYSGVVKVSVTKGTTTQTPQQPNQASRYFTDVTTDYNWAYPAIDYLYEQNIVTGTSGNNYSPGANIKRGDFILMLYRAYDLNATVTGNFKDVSSSKYYYKAIGVAKALGIAKGDDTGKFNPEAPLSRQDACVFLDRTLDVINKSLPDGTAANLSTFTDKNKIKSYAQIPVATLVRANIITGYSGPPKTFKPEGNLTRAEMAVILYRELK